MLKVVHISTNGFVERPKETKREAFIQEALETLAIRQHQDLAKARQLFSAELQELELKEARYNGLLKRIEIAHK